jgi:hypothetical protein
MTKLESPSFRFIHLLFGKKKNNNNNLKIKKMKKLALVSVCVLGLVFAGSAANQAPAKKEPVKKEVVKSEAKKEVVNAEKKAAPKKGLKVEKKSETPKK